VAINVLSAESRKPLTLQRTIIVLLSQFVLLLIIAVIGLSVGSVSISFSDVVNSFVNPTVVDAVNQTIILDIRLPRLLLAMIVGAGLSIAGVVFQALLRNPLAEPYILGISSGGHPFSWAQHS
jgi:iron complex transport system permease protein